MLPSWRESRFWVRGARPPLFFGFLCGGAMVGVSGRVACTLFGSALTGCASGGVFGVCGFLSPARAPCLSVR